MLSQMVEALEKDNEKMKNKLTSIIEPESIKA
jgi:hypothetical protein